MIRDYWNSTSPSAGATALDLSECFAKPLPTMAVLLAMVILLSACGGGGGGGGGVGGSGGNDDAGGDTGNSDTGNSDTGNVDDNSNPPIDFQAQAETIADRYRSRSEFSSQGGLSRIRADRAYAHVELATGSGVGMGKGVTIGILDTGIDLDHPAFVTTPSDPDKNRKISRQFLFLPSVSVEDGSKFSHGTAVAGVAAGGRNIGLSRSAHGVAWNANLAVFAIPLGTREPNYVYRPTNLAFSGVRGLSHWFSTPLAWRGSDGERVDVLNLSFGIAGLIEGYSEAELRTHLGAIIQVMAQGGVAEKTIFVWAASNDHGHICDAGAECVNGRVNATSPSVLSGLPAMISELRGHVIAAVSVGRDGEISHFSNRCGIAAEWCLAAPGEGLLAPYFGPTSSTNDTEIREYRRVSGTSFAAPMVSGGLALMKQLFRDQLSNTALVSRLMATANKSGRYADEDLYGQGLMDLGAATTPVGQTTLAFGNRVGGPGGNLKMSSVTLSNAFGDGLAQSFAGREIVSFDSLGAPFWFDLGGFASTARIPSMGRQLKSFMAQTPAAPGTETRRTAFFAGPRKAGSDRWRLGFLETPTGVEGGHFALARYANTLTFTGLGDLAATAFSTEGLSWQAPTSGVALSWRPSDTWVGLRAGWLAERESLLGSSSKGAFGRLSSDSAFVGVDVNTEVDGWHLGANAEVGVVTATPHRGLITDVSPATTGAFAFRATRPFSDGRQLQFSVSQPLRVESGRATLSVPIGRTKDGQVARQSVVADIAPTGRQIDVTAHWRQSLSADGELRLGAVWTHNPGHSAAKDSDFSLLAAWRTAF